MTKRSESREVGTEGLALFALHTPIPVGPNETFGEAMDRKAKALQGRLDAEVAQALYAPAARTTDPATSHLAAASMRSVAHTQRLSILEHLEKCGERGCTADELDRALNWRVGRSGRRLGELLKAGLVRVAPTTRETATGRQAQVYALPVYARG